LTSFNRFQRSAVQEFLCFAAKTLTERTQIGEKQSVKEAEYRIHIFVRSDSLIRFSLSDHEYPHRVAHMYNAHKSFRRFYKPGHYNLWFWARIVLQLKIEYSFLKKYKKTEKAKFSR
jgi:hypothetical protein